MKNIFNLILAFLLSLLGVVISIYVTGYTFITGFYMGWVVLCIVGFLAYKPKAFRGDTIW